MAGSEYYDHTTYPSQGAAGSSAAMRSELGSVENGFGKLPGLAGNGGKIVVVNAGGTALEATSTPALGAATGTSFNGVTITPVAAAVLTLFNGSTLATSGAFSLTLTATAATNVTLPTTGTLATLAGTETLTNKTLTSPEISAPTGITATNISNTPAGGIAATTVQAALNELDAEKAKSGANSDITSLGNNTSAVYTTAGTSTAYTLTPTPAITAYTAGQSFFVTFNAAPGATPTLAISGVATPPNLVKQLADGTYANIAANDFPANHRSRVTLLSASQALIETMPPVVGARCAVYVSTDQTMATALTFYTLAMDTEVYDVYSEFNTGTYTFTAKDAGKYRICATASMSLGSSGDWGEVAVYAGATRVRTARASTADSSAAKCSPQINTVLILAAGDTVTIRGQFNSGTASRSIDGAGLLGERTFMSIDRIG